MSLLFVNSIEGKAELIDLHTKSTVCSYNTGNSYRYACCYCPHIHLITLHHIRRCAFFLSPHHHQIVQRSFTTSVITSCAITTCGTFMIAGSDSGHLCVWNVRTSELIKSCKAHLRAITCIALSHMDNNSLVATTSADAECKVWTLGSLVEPHTSHNSITSSIGNSSVRPQYMREASNINNSNAIDHKGEQEEEEEEEEHILPIAGHVQQISSNNYVDDGNVKPLSTCTAHTLSVEVCAFMHHCNDVWIGSSDKTCRVFDACTGRVRYTWTVGESVSAIALSESDSFCVIGTTRGTLLIRELSSSPATWTKMTIVDSKENERVDRTYPHALHHSGVERITASLTHGKSNAEDGMREPITIAPSMDGHHSCIVHVSFLRLPNVNEPTNVSNLLLCDKILSVSEDGSVLIHNVYSGKLCGDKIQLPQMRIASCCVVPQRTAAAAALSLRKDSESKKNFRGLSKNLIDLSHGGGIGIGAGGNAESNNSMTVAENVQVIKVSGDVDNLVERYKCTMHAYNEKYKHSHCAYLHNTTESKQTSSMKEKNSNNNVTKRSQVSAQASEQELEQLLRDNTELEQMKQKLERKLQKAIKRQRQE